MRAVRQETVGELHVREVEERPPGARELVVRVEACGICGTDRHILRGEYPAHLPVTLGHEFAGEVVAMGAQVALPVGTRIAVDPNIACGRCRECRRGDVCLCPRHVALGVDLDGGLAEYAVFPRRRRIRCRRTFRRSGVRCASRWRVACAGSTWPASGPA
jgi:L-iditol 2-dehydrogenase